MLRVHGWVTRSIVIAAITFCVLALASSVYSEAADFSQRQLIEDPIISTQEAITAIWVAIILLTEMACKRRKT